MKDKHLNITADNELLRCIYHEVNEKLIINKASFYFKIWLKFIFYFSLVGLSYSLIYLVGKSSLLVSCYVLFGFLSILFAFNFSHDLSHNTVFKSKKLNNIGFTLIYTIVGAHAEAWKQRHVESHHHAPNVEEYDSDLQISKLMRVTPTSEHLWFHKYQHLYAPFAYTIYSLFWIFIKDFVILFSKDEFTEKKGFRYHLVFWIQKLSYLSFILVLPLIFSGHRWTTIFVRIFLDAFITICFFAIYIFHDTSCNGNRLSNYRFQRTDKNLLAHESDKKFE